MTRSLMILLLLMSSLAGCSTSSLFSSFKPMGLPELHEPPVADAEETNF